MSPRHLHQTHTLGLSIDEQPVEIAARRGLADSVTQGAVPEGQVAAALQREIGDHPRPSRVPQGRGRHTLDELR